MSHFNEIESAAATAYKFYRSESSKQSKKPKNFKYYVHIQGVDMKFKTLVAASVIGFASFGALAAPITFDAGYAEFTSGNMKSATTTFTRDFTFDGVTSGAYNVMGNMSSSYVTFTTATLNGQSFQLSSTGNFNFAGISTVANTPFVIHVVGNKTANETARFNGSLSVTPVPEPETLAMMLAGLGLIGAVTRRRSNKVDAA